jgi:formylmethanofuran dehydrogenase subunit E
MIAQKEWLKKAYKDKKIKPWICKCGDEAVLHRTNKKGKHEFLCNNCIEKEIGGYY